MDCPEGGIGTPLGSIPNLEGLRDGGLGLVLLDGPDGGMGSPFGSIPNLEVLLGGGVSEVLLGLVLLDGPDGGIGTPFGSIPNLSFVGGGGGLSKLLLGDGPDRCVGVHPHVLRNFLTPCFMAASKAIFSSHVCWKKLRNKCSF